MNIHMSSKYLSTAFAILATLWMSGVGTARANNDTYKALSVQVSLTSARKIVLGEPITLHSKVSNISDKKVGVHWGEGNWYSFSLTDDKGKSVTFMAPRSKPAPVGFRAVPDPFIEHGRQVQKFLTITQHLAVPRPGNYTLILHVRLPYTVVETTEEDPTKAEDEINAQDNVFSQDYIFRLSVAPANDLVLRAKANALMQMISTEPFGPMLQANTAALFSMPEAQALASWEALAHNVRPVNAGGIADALAGIHSVRAVDLLVEMLDNPNLSFNEASLVRAKIDESYNSGNATVKRHIKALAASRGTSMPDKVVISQPSD